MKKIHFVLALGALVVAGPAAVTTTPASAQTTATSQTCDVYVAAMYMNHQTSVTCHDNVGAETHTYYVNDTDSPSAAEVLSFIETYQLTVKTIQLLPPFGTKTAIQSFSSRVVLYLSSGKITGLRIL